METGHPIPKQLGANLVSVCVINQLYQQYTSLVDTLQRHSSIVGFSVGNEVAQSAESTKDVAFLKLQSTISRRTSRPKDVVPPWKSDTRTKTLMRL